MRLPPGPGTSRAVTRVGGVKHRAVPIAGPVNDPLVAGSWRVITERLGISGRSEPGGHALQTAVQQTGGLHAVQQELRADAEVQSFTGCTIKKTEAVNPAPRPMAVADTVSGRRTAYGLPAPDDSEINEAPDPQQSDQLPGRRMAHIDSADTVNSAPPQPVESTGGWSTVINSDGSKYDGQWKDGKRDGQGVLTHQDGSKYDGQWKDGKEHGQGVWTHPD
eukprot:COSAG01_NODE_21239_length_911_cov_1.640394_1_plen_219_part_10